MIPATNCPVPGRTRAGSGVPGRTRAKKKKGRGDWGLRRRHAETCETMLCRDDDKGGAECRFSGRDDRKQPLAASALMTAAD